MPKLVDVDARRRELLDAVWRIIPAKGIAGVTTRAIAREAGVSNGVLSHYFADKDSLLIEALRSSYDRTHERMRATSAGLTGLGALRQVMIEALPLDADRLVEAQIGVSFSGLALGNPALTAVVRTEWERFWDLLSVHVAQAEALGELADDVDLDNFKLELMMLVEAFSRQAVLYPERLPSERQVQILDELLARVSPPTR